jgi:hypothetical protein
MVIVALGEPNTPVTWGAEALDAWAVLFSAVARRGRRNNCAELVDNRLKNNANTNPAATSRWQHRFAVELFNMTVSCGFSKRKRDKNSDRRLQDGLSVAVAGHTL